MFRSIFFGTPEFSVPSLEALHAISDVVCVFSQPDRPSGRGQQLHPTPIKVCAHRLGLRLEQPTKIKTPEFESLLQSLKVDVALVVAYGRILPRAVLEAPKKGCVNVHASLLPRWRGAAPIQRAIEAGDKETGVCLMQMDEGLDTGPIFDVARLSIDENETSGELATRLSQLGAERIKASLTKFVNGELLSAPQSKDGVTYAQKLTKDEARIDWTSPAVTVHNKVRAFQPNPGVWADVTLDGHVERLKILQTSLSVAHAFNHRPGEVMRDAQAVMCGDRPLKLQWVQKAGSKAMTMHAWLVAKV